MEYFTSQKNCPFREARKTVNLAAISYNLDLIKAKCSGKEIMPIVKADAYGHGAVEVARHLESEDYRWFGVAYADEALQLREAGIMADILVMGMPHKDSLPALIKQDIAFALSTTAMLNEAETAAQLLRKQAVVHLKIDTGMNRLGFRLEELEALADKVLRLDSVRIGGVFSHFACADEPQHPQNRVQIDAFGELLRTLTERGVETGLRHICNSAGALHFPEAHYDLLRVGICMYGCSPGPLADKSLPFKSAMSISGEVRQVVRLKAGGSVSYGATWTADSEGWLVNLPIGYGDGYLRSLSNGKGQVIINGKKFLLTGRVCMDQILCFTGDNKVDVGDKWCLMGSQDNLSITPDELAELAGTIPYEILTNFSERLSVVYIKQPI